MSKMAPLLGKEMTERLFLIRFCEMCTDPLFHVRKVSCVINKMLFGPQQNVIHNEERRQRMSSDVGVGSAHKRSLAALGMNAS